MIPGQPIPPLSLRRADAGDAARLSLIGGATFLATFAHDHGGDDIVAHTAGAHGAPYYAKALADPACALWLVETPLKAPVGYAMLCPPDMDFETGPGDLELKRIYMLSGYAGSGWGGRLVEAVVSEARSRGAARLLLSVYEHNLPSQAFYERNGFAWTGAAQDFITGGTASTDLIYARPLEPAAPLA